MLRKKVFLYVSFVKSVQFVCAIIRGNVKIIDFHFPALVRFSFSYDI